MDGNVTSLDDLEGIFASRGEWSNVEVEAEALECLKDATWSWLEGILFWLGGGGRGERRTSSSLWCKVAIAAILCSFFRMSPSGRRLHAHLIFGALGIKHGEEHVPVTITFRFVGIENVTKSRRGRL